MEARAAGIVAVYRTRSCSPHLDVAENVFMGLHPRTWLGTVDRRRMYERTRELLRELEADLDPRGTGGGLSIGEVQFVEFARAMARGWTAC